MDIKSWKTRAKQLRTEIVALYLPYKHARTPWYAKVLAALIIGYALSPIDLIPDFIPVIGYLDDFILVPLGIALLIKIIPRDILEECRAKAQSDLSKRKPKNRIAAIIIVLIWLFAIYLALSLLWPLILPFSGDL
ncbi:MAG: YkvA family protein [Thermodesulfobacteriota bacterium]